MGISKTFLQLLLQDLSSFLLLTDFQIPTGNHEILSGICNFFERWHAVFLCKNKTHNNEIITII